MNHTESCHIGRFTYLGAADKVKQIFDTHGKGNNKIIKAHSF